MTIANSPADNGAYAGWDLPALLSLIASMGKPDEISKAAENWDGMAKMLVASIGAGGGADLTTVNGLLDVLKPHWQGAAAEALGNHFGDMSNYGMDVAAHANLGQTSGPGSNTVSFHTATSDAFTALSWVKSEAAKIQPRTQIINNDEAKATWLDSLPPGRQRLVRPALNNPNSGWLTEQSVQPEINQFADAHNQAVAADRARAVQLLKYLGDVYDSIADAMPTKPQGTPPTLHDASPGNHVAGFGLGGGPGLGSPAAAGVPGGLAHGALSNGALPTAAHGATPGLGAHPSGAPLGTDLGAAAGSHPLAAAGRLPAGALSSGGDPTTQLANFTPSDLASGAGLGAGGLLPFTSTPAGSGAGIGGLPSFGAAGPTAFGSGGLPGGAIPAGLAAGGFGPLGMVPGGFGAGGAGSGGAGLRPSLGGLSGGGRGGIAATGGGELPGVGGNGAASLAAERSAAGEAAAGRAAAANEGALAGRAAANGGLAARGGASGGMPMMPYMPMGGMGGQGTDGGSRRTWLDEDDDVWQDDIRLLAPPVIGRPG